MSAVDDGVGGIFGMLQPIGTWRGLVADEVPNGLDKGAVWVGEAVEFALLEEQVVVFVESMAEFFVFAS